MQSEQQMTVVLERQPSICYDGRKADFLSTCSPQVQSHSHRPLLRPLKNLLKNSSISSLLISIGFSGVQFQCKHWINKKTSCFIGLFCNSFQVKLKIHYNFSFSQKAMKQCCWCNKTITSVNIKYFKSVSNQSVNFYPPKVFHQQQLMVRNPACKALTSTCCELKCD